MNTAKIMADVFRARTEGRKAIYKINNLTIDAVKIVLKGELIKLETIGALEDEKNGFLKRKNCTGFHGGRDGYIPTAKGYKTIFEHLNQ